MHQIRVALLRNELLRGGRLAAGIQRWPRLRHRLRLQNVVFDPIIFSRKGKMILRPHSVQHLQPFAGACVTVVVLLETDAILPRFIRPPRRHHVQRQPPAADVIDVRGLLGQQRRQMKRRAHRHHQLNSLRNRRQRRCRGPRIQRRRLHSLDIVQIQLGNQRHVESQFLAALRQPLHVRPRRLHVFIRDVAQPPAEHRKPVSVSHAFSPAATSRAGCFTSLRRASSIKKSARRPYGLKPSMRSGSATKFERALMS